MCRSCVSAVLPVTVLLGLGWLVSGRVSGAAEAPVTEGPETSRPLVGVSYFAGWWQALPNKWNYNPEVGDWRPEFPDRLPLLGEYNVQATMDREIVAAAEHGVDFFLILWYYNGPNESQEREKNARFLNEGVKTFMHSPEAHRIQFAIEFCNHQPYQVKNDEDWAHCVQTWVEAMRHPSYLRVGGRPVFKVHSWHHFWDENGKDVKRCRERLDFLRRAAGEAGLGEVLIGCGIPSGETIGAGHPAGELFAFTGTYMEVPGLPQREADYPYEKLAQFIRQNREQHGKDKIPYVPYLGAGFNAKPWPDDRRGLHFPHRTSGSSSSAPSTRISYVSRTWAFRCPAARSKKPSPSTPGMSSVRADLLHRPRVKAT